MPPIFGSWFKPKAISATKEATDALLVEATNAAAARDFTRALQLCDRVITLDPSRAEAYYKRGNVLKDLGRLEQALANYDQAIELRGDYGYAYCNRGVVQHSLGLGAAALASYDQAIVLEPADEIVHYNRALLMQDHLRWDEALASYDQAVAIDPSYADAQYNRAVLLLFRGDYFSGWRAYEWRWKIAQRLSIGEARRFKEPLWLGEGSLFGKRLLLYSEAGLGDTLQFCRYAPLCAQEGAIVILQVPQSLTAVLGGLDGVSQIVAAGSSLSPFDYQCPLMSLPLAFKTTIDTIPASPRYLRADRDKVAYWNGLMGERRRPRIGLAWSGNPSHTNDLRRSIALANWVPYLTPEFQFYRLQNHVRDRDKSALGSSAIVSFDDDLLDFSNIAALCECMDLVISVDTSLAHLSGSLGRPTWVLLPFTPDWRWLLGRDDTPWYPTMRLYRQDARDDWNGVLTKVAKDIRRTFTDV